MHSLVFTCLVALPSDRNDSDLKSGLCLSVVSTPRHGNTFAFKPRPLNPHFLMPKCAGTCFHVCFDVGF
jgi:hypothetical protein